VIKQRFLGLALALALLGSIGFAATASAETVKDDVVFDASIADVLTITVSPSSFTFGSNLNFKGANAQYGYCPNGNGVTYLGPYSPGVVVTVESNRPYELTREVTPYGTFLENRLYVKESGWVDCAENAGSRQLLTTGPESIGTGGPTAGTDHVNFFSFDVRVEDAAGPFGASIFYSATAI
jgi:hypothetical protein